MSDYPERLLFDSPSIRIGAFRCPVGHRLFEDSGPIQNYVFVFPRSSVSIEHEQGPPFVANPNVVTFYNRGQVFRRRAIDPDGDRCEWFAIPGEVARDAVREFDDEVDSNPYRPFRLARGWSDPSTYLMQRRLILQLESGAAVDPLYVEEQVIRVFHCVLRSAYGRGTRSWLRRDVLHHVEAILSARLDQRLLLADLATAAGVSAFHLCRAFRRQTGVSLHQYRRRLRLLAALEPVCDARRRLVDVALDAGFSSHSHFTSAFHSEFGWSPSKLRKG